MRVALTGVSGHIGSYTAQALHAAGHQVTGLVRATSRRQHQDEACWPELLNGADAVIHNSIDWFAISGDPYSSASLNADLVASIRLMAVSAPRAFVYVSSVSAITDILPRWNHYIEQDHPARPSNPYGALKAAVEQYLTAEYLGNQRHVAAVRPSGVYGLDPRLERSIGYDILQAVRSGQPFRRPGGGKFVHVKDVAAVLTACVQQPETAGQVFSLADCYARWADWATMAAEELGLQADIDLSSPAEPLNTFSKSPAADFGVPLDRGHAGIRSAIRELIEAME